MSDSIKLYGKFTKQDNDKKIVEGWASTEVMDSQGEVVKASALKNALSDYMQYGNLREMHQWSAVGKAVAAKVSDGKKKGLWIRGKIVDDNAWKKVKAKVYSGFSIGGKIVKKIGNAIEELVLNEISLVDRPANPEAVFSLVKIKSGKVIEKQDGMSGIPHPGIQVADSLIAMAARLIPFSEMNAEMGRPYKHIEKAISAIKDAAMFELNTEKAVVVGELHKREKERRIALELLKDEVSDLQAEVGFQKGEGNYFEMLKENL